MLLSPNETAECNSHPRLDEVVVVVVAKPKSVTQHDHNFRGFPLPRAQLPMPELPVALVFTSSTSTPSPLPEPLSLPIFHHRLRPHPLSPLHVTPQAPAQLDLRPRPSNTSRSLLAIARNAPHDSSPPPTALCWPRRRLPTGGSLPGNMPTAATGSRYQQPDLGEH